MNPIAASAGGPPSLIRRIPRIADGLVSGGVVSLIVLTPIAFGTVHRWAFSLTEVVIFALLTVWMVKVLVSGSRTSVAGGVWSPELRRLASPLALFLTLLLFELLPLPPSVIHVLSPATYRLYEKSIPGWPNGEKSISDASEDGSRAAQASEAPAAVLPTPDEVKRGAPLPFRGVSRSTNQTPAVSATTPPSGAGTSETVGALAEARAAADSSWRTLSISPDLTRVGLLKALAYTSLFLLMVFYPFEPGGEEKPQWRFCRRVVVSVLAAGLLVALIGLTERVFWNGRILWFFVPQDWGSARPLFDPRATGPFVNPDHFANYLGTILPLALAVVLFPFRSVSIRSVEAVRVAGAVTAFILFAAILLSLSRGGWIAAMVGAWLVAALYSRSSRHDRSSSRQASKFSFSRLLILGSLSVIALALFFVGPEGRAQTDVRLADTVFGGVGLWQRTSVWRDSLGMIRDFPLFGVGLGAWPELFRHYQSPPWSAGFFRAAHNDYLQLLAETGVVGFAFLTWFFYLVPRTLFAAARRLSGERLILVAGGVSALGVMAVHEFFDFNLHTPANALLFTVLLGIAIRASTLNVRHEPITPRVPHARRNLLFGSMALAALILTTVALAQRAAPYPYYMDGATSASKVREILADHPANSEAHLTLLALARGAMTPALRLRHIQSAVWLEPTNPHARDLYARALIRRGRVKEGLTQITQAVADSPSPATHRYLSGRLIPWLSAVERKAVQAGFERAIASEDQGAVEPFGAFYRALGLYSDRAEVFERAAESQDDEKTKVDYLISAGKAFLQAAEPKRAELMFRRAMRIAPQDPRPYQDMARLIFGPSRDVAAARAVIAQGINRGADPLFLSLALADAAQRAGDLTTLKKALLQALGYRPSSVRTMIRLGRINMDEKNFGPAILMIRKAIDLEPESAEAYYYLGLAYEGSYDYAAAARALAHAVSLAPENRGYQNHYSVFRQKFAKAADNR